MTQTVSMPYVVDMGDRLVNKQKQGILGVRMFVQRNEDASYDDIAHDFLEMDVMRSSTPYDTSLDF